ncbi:MAG: TonB-dependent receptor, partial [Halieaceae bacterium]
AGALTNLLEDSGLGWELVGERVIAIYAIDCSADDSCPSPMGTVEKYPLFEPGIEETLVYGTQLTGSRIKRTAYDTSAPVDVFSAPDIELSGAQTLGELLKFVPAVSGNAISTAISNGGDGTASVTLRGLPASNTLVLINGRRVANDGLAGDSVDLNSIPPAAVERIEILKDGASAIYGSDAIAGVVNVITRSDFEGFLAETYFGETEQGDLTTQTHTLQYGAMIPRGSVFLSATLFDQDPIFSRDREISRNADTRRLGGSDERSSATPDSRVTLPDAGTVIATASGYRPATDEDLFNYLDFTTAVVPLERNSLYGSFEYDLTSDITASIDASYLETESEATLAPTPVFTGFEQTPITVAADNIYNNFGQELTDVRRRLVELPDRKQRNESEVSRFSAIVEGQTADWYWDVGYNWSRSEASERTVNLINADNLRRGVGPAANCLGLAIDNCVPVNLLGAAGTLDGTQVGFLRASGEVSGYTKLAGFSGNLSGRPFEIQHGSIDVAFGAELRKESTSKRPDALLASTGTIGGTNFEATSGSRDIIELYAETNIPVWKSGTQALDLEAALRHSDYSDFGDSTNPKFGLRWRLAKGLMLRATYAEGFRAPSLNELFEGNTEEQAFINDPCTQPANVGVLPGCSQQADPTRNQFLTIRGGNPDLKPETSESWGAGVVWSPSSLTGLTLSADIF